MTLSKVKRLTLVMSVATTRQHRFQQLTSALSAAKNPTSTGSLDREEDN